MNILVLMVIVNEDLVFIISNMKILVFIIVIDDGLRLLIIFQHEDLSPNGDRS